MTIDAGTGPGGVHPDLVGLVRGELGNAEVSAAAVHLRGCAECRSDLAEYAVGHALLSRAGRTLGPDGLSIAIGESEPPPRLSVGDLEAAFPEQPTRSRRGPRILAGAAALVVAAGLGIGVGTLVADRDGAPPTPQRTATLEAVTGDGSGEVSMTEDGGHTSMTIRTQDLPAAKDGQFYYAWLLDPATNKMLPLGQVGPSGTASFEVSDTLLAAYSSVDVSLEHDDGDPQHSPTSVLRASYA